MSYRVTEVASENNRNSGVANFIIFGHTLNFYYFGTQILNN